MATNTNVLEIKIKAQLPVGKNLADAFAAMSLAVEAQKTGNYADLLAAATILEVSVDQRNRRITDDGDQDGFDF